MQMKNEQELQKTEKAREIQRLEELHKKRPEVDGKFQFQGVLLSDAIKQCVDEFNLIEPFNPENLKPACYKLTIGDTYSISGNVHVLHDESGKRQVKIPPFAVAVIKTHETINMPRFLIGRWNIQVSRAYQGLLWVGGPQVDAGYVGHLFCPIYNLSDQDVVLYKGDDIAVIDFTRTTEFHPGHSKNYPFPPERVLFDDYKPTSLISGLVTKVQERLNGLQKKIDTNVDRVDRFITITIASIAVLFAALSVSGVGRESPTWQMASVYLLSLVAIFMAASAWLEKTRGQLFSRIVQILILAGIIVAFVFQGIAIWKQESQYIELRQEFQELRELQNSPSTAEGESGVQDTNTPINP